MSNPTELPDLDRIANDLESEAIPYEGDFADAVRAAIEDIREVAAARRAQPEGESLEGRIVSIDVSTGEHDAGNRIFAELTGETASDGTTLLAIEEQRNFGKPEGEAPQGEALKVSTDQHEVSISAQKIDMSAQQAARAMRVIGGQRWSKEAEMTEGWLAAQQAAAPGALTLLNADELAALHRFQETCQDFDSGGYDVDKNMMKRLASIGVIESKGFNRYQFTEFGDYVVENQVHSAPGTPEAPEDVQRDAERFRWIEENCRTEGGGHGFTVFVPVDHEDIGCGIDAAIQRAAQLGGGQEGSESNG